MRVPPFQPVAAGEYRRIDMMSSEGANRLARKIEAAWRAVGHPQMRCSTEAILSGAGMLLGYAVRSNLRNGVPA